MYIFNAYGDLFGYLCSVTRASYVYFTAYYFTKSVYDLFMTIFQVLTPFHNDTPLLRNRILFLRLRNYHVRSTCVSIIFLIRARFAF